MIACVRAEFPVELIARRLLWAVVISEISLALGVHVLSATLLAQIARTAHRRRLFRAELAHVVAHLPLGAAGFCYTPHRLWRGLQSMAEPPAPRLLSLGSRQF